MGTRMDDPAADGQRHRGRPFARTETGRPSSKDRHILMTRVLIPSGALGLGFDRTALQRGVDNKPDIIAIDGGSTDSGPSYLGQGVSKYSTGSTKSEWRDLMLARAAAKVPLVIGTAGTCGADKCHGLARFHQAAGHGSCALPQRQDQAWRRRCSGQTEP